MTQREGVFAAVMAVVGNVDSGTPVKLDDKQKSEVIALIANGFRSGQIEYRGGCPDNEKLAKYIPGLLNNWLRKDTRLNGGAEYEPKNPGSRAGSGDEAIKAMKQLLSITTDSTARAQIEKAIEERKLELKPSAKDVDFSKLPESLRHLAPTTATKVVIAVPPTVRRLS